MLDLKHLDGRRGLGNYLFVKCLIILDQLEHRNKTVF